MGYSECRLWTGVREWAIPSPLVILTVVLVMTAACTAPRDLGDRDALMWEPEQWSLRNLSWLGSPYDVAATATFIHESSGERRATEMYYDGGVTWRFRFTGVRPGLWNFTTSSSDGALDGHTGSVTVAPSRESDASGFLAYDGNRFVLPVENGQDVRWYIFNVYMNGQDFPPRQLEAYDEAKINAYCAEAKEFGFEILFFHVTNQWFSLGAFGYDEHRKMVPDRRTFLILERIIQTARRGGCRVHLWAWGDEARRWTPVGVGGINGTPDRRVQRYIAARLGPLPGWTLGYGFDLIEWVTGSELDAWAGYLHEHLGWPHLLSARGHDIAVDHTIHSYPITDAELGDFGTPPALPEVPTIREQLRANRDGPHLYEERHAWRRWGLDEDDTRRLLWRTAMAGGMGGWYGFYDQPSRYSDPPPYPPSLRAAFRTHYAFWHGGRRLTPDLIPDATGFGGSALRAPDDSLLLLYQEDTDFMDVALPEVRGGFRLIAVDTRQPYREIDLGTRTFASGTIDLPASSDWVIVATAVSGPDPEEP